MLCGCAVPCSASHRPCDVPRTAADVSVSSRTTNEISTTEHTTLKLAHQHQVFVHLMYDRNKVDARSVDISAAAAAFPPLVCALRLPPR
jgi:hypothetical protein